MHIEIWKTKAKGQPWRWHFKAGNGRIVGDAEAFPTKANAMRAAKACVRAVVKRIFPLSGPIFSTTEKDGITYLSWV